MNNGITFAKSGHKKMLTELFTESGMDLAGAVEDHILLKSQDEIIAAAFVDKVEKNLFHLAVFAVNPDRRNEKIGSYLLQEILKEPQKYCRSQSSDENNFFQITTVAKGREAGFYKKHGFDICDFSQLNYPYNIQCEECPAKDDCNPMPLIFSKTKYIPQSWIS
jgi:N-acetylglutamate synthase-like GNAT family acetyltransferase